MSRCLAICQRGPYAQRPNSRPRNLEYSAHVISWHFSLPSYPDANVSMPDAFPADKGSSMEYWSDDEPPHHPESSPCLIPDNPHVTRHTYTGIPRLSDTWPHTCMILNQNVNGLVSRDDKLERIIEVVIDRNIHRYCLQETWKLGKYCKTIYGHTLFHHGVKDRPLTRKAVTVRESWSYLVPISPAHGRERANWHHFSPFHHQNSPAVLSASPWASRTFPTARKTATITKRKAPSNYSYAPSTTHMPMHNRRNFMTSWRVSSVAELASRNCSSGQILTATSESARWCFETYSKSRE